MSPSRLFHRARAYHLICRTIGMAALCVWFGAWSGAAAMVRAETGALPEFALKSAYLYQFTLFIEWPVDAFDDPNDPIVVCVLGDDPFGPFLDALNQKTSQARPLQVRRVPRVKDAGGCHVLFISASERARLTAVLASLANRRVLTVSDIEGFAGAGGIVEFVPVENKIRFGINLEAAKKSGLRISSKLLSLAMLVNQGTSEGGAP